jgi:hypothetical protein
VSDLNSQLCMGDVRKEPDTKLEDLPIALLTPMSVPVLAIQLKLLWSKGF